MERNFISLLIVNRKLLSKLVIILCGVITFLHAGTSNTFSSWFTTYFKDLNVPVTISSLMLSLYSLIIGLGMLVKSYLVVKFNEKKVMQIFSILSFIFLFTSFFISLLVIKIVLILLFGFSIAAIALISISMGIKLKPRYSGSITSILSSFGWMGVVIFQYITGYLTENYSGVSLIYVSLTALFLLIVFTSILSYYYRLDSND